MSVPKSKRKRTRGERCSLATGSNPAREAKAMIADAEAWAEEYSKREADYRKRGAHREAAHYEDLLCAHQCHAQKLRQLLALIKSRQPERSG